MPRLPGRSIPWVRWGLANPPSLLAQSIRSVLSGLAFPLFPLFPADPWGLWDRWDRSRQRFLPSLPAPSGQLAQCRPPSLLARPDPLDPLDP
jgi:hypothetical protein